MKTTRMRSIAAGVLLALGMPIAGAEDAPAVVATSCAGCHSLEQPDYATLGIGERAERKGPPLHYAGNKFREEWLAAWLENPERLRPGGVFAPAHAVATADGDAIDPATLVEHPKLSAADAAAVAGYLMTLKPLDGVLEGQAYEPGTIALRMGQMNFSKFKGCDSCHQDTPDFGGVSGPELYTAWERLQPAFISAYIADPTAFDAHTMMPKSGLNDTEVFKLADYLKALAEAEQ